MKALDSIWEISVKAGGWEEESFISPVTND